MFQEKGVKIKYKIALIQAPHLNNVEANFKSDIKYIYNFIKSKCRNDF